MADFQGQKERLKAFVKYTGLPVYKFEARCGLSNGYISSMRKGIGYKALEQISETFPELNTAWLQTGEGEMLKSAQAPEPAAEAAPIEAPADSSGFVSIPADAWNVIKQQAASLERKDAQVDRVISLLENALNETKKTGPSLDAPSSHSALSGAGKVGGSQTEHL